MSAPPSLLSCHSQQGVFRVPSPAPPNSRAGFTGYRSPLTSIYNVSRSNGALDCLANAILGEIGTSCCRVAGKPIQFDPPSYIASDLCFLGATEVSQAQQLTKILPNGKSTVIDSTGNSGSSFSEKNVEDGLWNVGLLHAASVLEWVGKTAGGSSGERSDQAIPGRRAPKTRAKRPGGGAELLFFAEAQGQSRIARSNAKVPALDDQTITCAQIVDLNSSLQPRAISSPSTRSELRAYNSSSHVHKDVIMSEYGTIADVRRDVEPWHTWIFPLPHYNPRPNMPSMCSRWSLL
ncbi:hypothetical protein BD779DRAFT_1477063 [Infundibulicybe gibba]|nr:hypothetical protein BD779DRAFT_1477063 [Infundibulicybe gibba]